MRIVITKGRSDDTTVRLAAQFPQFVRRLCGSRPRRGPGPGSRLEGSATNIGHFRAIRRRLHQFRQIDQARLTIRQEMSVSSAGHVSPVAGVLPRSWDNNARTSASRASVNDRSSARPSMPSRYPSGCSCVTSRTLTSGAHPGQRLSARRTVRDQGAGGYRGGSCTGAGKDARWVVVGSPS